MVKFKLAWTAGLWSDSRWDSRELPKVFQRASSLAGFCRAVSKVLQRVKRYMSRSGLATVFWICRASFGIFFVDWSMDLPWRQVGLWRSIAWGTLVNSWSCYWSVLRPLLPQLFFFCCDLSMVYGCWTVPSATGEVSSSTWRYVVRFPWPWQLKCRCFSLMVWLIDSSFSSYCSYAWFYFFCKKVIPWFWCWWVHVRY